MFAYQSYLGGAFDTTKWRVSLAPLPNDILWQHWDVHPGNKIFRLLSRFRAKSEQRDLR